MSIYEMTREDLLVELEGLRERCLEIERSVGAEHGGESVKSHSGKRFRAMALSANDAIITSDSSKRIISWNKSAEGLFGYEESEVLDRTLDILIPQRYKNGLNERIGKLEASGRTSVADRVIELYGMRKTSGEFPIELALSLWKKGEEIFFTVVIRDITERKRAGDELRARAMQQGSVSELGQLALTGIDTAILMEDAVKSVASILGVEFASVLEFRKSSDKLLMIAGAGWGEKMVDQAELDAWEDSQAGYTLLTGESVSVKDFNQEKRFKMSRLLKDYQIASGLSTLIFGKEEPFGVLVVHSVKKRTFTKDDEYFLQSVANVLAASVLRKNTERDLKSSRKNFENIVNKSPDGVIILNRKNIILFANPKVDSFLGRGSNSLIGSDFGFPITEGEKVVIETMSKDGRQAIVEMHTIGIEWAADPCYLVTLYDITSIKKAETTLQKANEELIKLDQMKSEFVSIASHELRTPLTSIKNAVDLILKRKAGDVSEVQERFLSMAERNINRLSALINDLLDISKIEAGKMDLNFEDIDMSSLANNVMSMFSTTADMKAITLEVRAEEELPSVYGDLFRVEQVFTNLVGNAIKFTPERGKIIVDLHQFQETSDISDRAMGFVEVFVSDTGVGIPENSVDKLFEKFYQVNSSLARDQQQPGTGLGLAICKGIVEAHGGKIHCRSKEGEGSTFGFTLPQIDKANMFYLILKAGIANANRNHTPLSIMIVKVDDFEHILREQGVEESKRILERIRSQILEGGVKNHDKVEIANPKGEIILIMPETDHMGAEMAKKRVGEYLAGLKITAGDQEITPSFATGIATFPEDGQTVKELIGSVSTEGLGRKTIENGQRNLAGEKPLSVETGVEE